MSASCNLCKEILLKVADQFTGGYVLLECHKKKTMEHCCGCETLENVRKLVKERLDKK
jgi:hypothetical protein